MAMTVYKQSQVFGGIIDVLEAIGATYAIWGGIAVVAYGEHRFTQDMDILLSPEQFVALRAPFARDTLPCRRNFGEPGLERRFFYVIHLGHHIKTDFYVPVEPELRAMIADRTYLPFNEMRRAAYITPTAVITAKLRAYADSQSTRHIDDIASIVRLQGSKLEPKQLDIASARMGLLGVWRALWAENRGR